MTLIIALFVLAIALALLEVFLLPGIGIAGIGAGLCTICAVVMTYVYYGIESTLVVTFLALGFFFFFLWYLARIVPKSKIALQAKIDSVAMAEEQYAVAVGDTGKAITRLALVGRASIGIHQIEVRSEEGFLEEDTPIVVSRTADGIVYVKRQ